MTAAAGLVAAVALAIAAGASPAARSATSPASVPRLGRVAVIVMENHEYGQIIGSSSAPYVNRLARRYALATAYHAIRHPSLPNYLALVGGSTFGVTDDCDDCFVNGDSLPAQLQAAGISWRAYMDGMPSTCWKGTNQGDYTRHHNPFLYFHAVSDHPDACRNVVPGGALTRDLAARRLPRFSWITPNNCENTHDCGVSTGDRFLSKLVPRVLRALGRHGVLFLTWDEGTTGRSGGGHIALIAAGPAARRHTRSSVPAGHYSLLGTIEDALGVGRLGSAANATSLASLLRG